MPRRSLAADLLVASCLAISCAEARDATARAGADRALPNDVGHPGDSGELAPDAPLEDVSAPGDAAVDAGVRMVSSYVALGSSSTQGSGASDPARTSYVALISSRLATRSPGAATTNLGGGGARVDHFLQQIDRIRRERPEIVTILPFTDYVQTPAGTFLMRYGELLDALGQIGSTVFFGDLRIDPTLVCGAGPGGPGGCYAQEDRDLLAAKNEALRQLAESRAHLVIVAVFDQNVAHPEWNAADGSHPNDLGHLYLADRFWESIDPWLGGR